MMTFKDPKKLKRVSGLTRLISIQPEDVPFIKWVRQVSPKHNLIERVKTVQPETSKSCPGSCQELTPLDSMSTWKFNVFRLLKYYKLLFITCKRTKL
ncbi:hypothetical protein HanIR_Chr05g0242811 [Helianthus annuus]|nr:hypothetical protein HanIR_Chr05g0242811 [Helianthus annuus]